MRNTTLDKKLGIIDAEPISVTPEVTPEVCTDIEPRDAALEAAQKASEALKALKKFERVKKRGENFELSRDALQFAIQNAKSALQDAVGVASQTGDSKTFESVSKLIDALSRAAEILVDSELKIDSIEAAEEAAEENEQQATNVQNNQLNIFTTTEEIIKMFSNTLNLNTR